MIAVIYHWLHLPALQRTFLRGFRRGVLGCDAVHTDKYGWSVSAQMVAEGRQVMANVHITPMRASRALALRYLATKFGVDIETLAVRGAAFHPSLQLF